MISTRFFYWDVCTHKLIKVVSLERVISTPTQSNKISVRKSSRVHFNESLIYSNTPPPFVLVLSFLTFLKTLYTGLDTRDSAEFGFKKVSGIPKQSMLDSYNKCSNCSCLFLMLQAFMCPHSSSLGLQIVL